MKKIMWAVMAAVLLIASNLFAADGDLLVEGILGVGSPTPNYLFKADGGLGSVSIKGGSAGTFKNGLYSVVGTDVKRLAQYNLTRTFDYDENDFGVALEASATRSGGVSSVEGLSAVLGIIHNSTISGVAGGSAASFTFQIGSATGSGTVDIDTVKGFNYTLNRRYNISHGLAYNVANSYGSYYGVNDGGSDWGGVVYVTNHYGSYISDYINTGGAKRVNITNHRGLYIENLVNSTNNTLLALGGATAGNWSIYNSAPYDNYFAGNTSIGTTNPQGYKLYVAGSIYASGGYYPSDERFKKDISAIDSPLNKILNIKGVSYIWKTDEYKDRGFSDGRHYGVIGQEIEKILPDIVRVNPNGEKSVAYTEMIPVLIEAMKEQQKIIDELKAKVQAVETRNITVSLH